MSFDYISLMSVFTVCIPTAVLCLFADTNCMSDDKQDAKDQREVQDLNAEDESTGKSIFLFLLVKSNIKSDNKSRR